MKKLLLSSLPPLKDIIDDLKPSDSDHVCRIRFKCYKTYLK